MWTIELNRKVSKSLKKLPVDVQVNFDIWADTAAVEGPMGLRLVTGFRDEALKGVWKGYRSSRLSKQYRVIYQVKKEIVSILVIDVNAHDYKRR